MTDTTYLPESDSAPLDAVRRSLDSLDALIERLESSSAFMGTMWGHLTDAQQVAIEEIVTGVSWQIDVAVTSMVVFLPGNEARSLASCGSAGSGKATESFCLYAISTAEDFVVTNAKRNKYVKDNPHVISGLVQSYCGIPVSVQSQVVGSFCAYESVPRRWTPSDLDHMHAGARAIETALAR